jgi:hypothetical protein
MIMEMLGVGYLATFIYLHYKINHIPKDTLHTIILNCTDINVIRNVRKYQSIMKVFHNKVEEITKSLSKNPNLDNSNATIYLLQLLLLKDKIDTNYVELVDILKDFTLRDLCNKREIDIDDILLDVHEEYQETSNDNRTKKLIHDLENLLDNKNHFYDKFSQTKESD